MSIFSKVLRVGEGKRLKELEQLVDCVNRLEAEVQPLSDAELRAKTAEFRQRLADGETLDDIECEAFAVVDVDQGQVVRTEYQTPPPHEPGVLPAWLHQLGVTVVICGGMGMRAQQLFAQNDIQVIYGAPSLPAEEL